MTKPDKPGYVADATHAPPLDRIRQLVNELHALLATVPQDATAPPPTKPKRRPKPNLSDLRPSPEMIARMAKVRRRLGLTHK